MVQGMRSNNGDSRMIDEIQPNYASYSIDELEDALRHVDSEAYPQRVQAIKQELQIKRAQHTAAKQANTEHSDNEQFFKCPSCLKSISFFSKAANSWGKTKTCPHCGAHFEVRMNYVALAIAVVPLVFVHRLLFIPILMAMGLPGAIGMGIVTGTAMALSMRFKKPSQD